jgi:hypothetical protein
MQADLKEVQLVLQKEENNQARLSEEDAAESPAQPPAEEEAKPPLLSRRSAKFIQDDPTLEGKYLERFEDISKDHLLNLTGSVDSWPKPFIPKPGRIKSALPVLFLGLLLVILVALFNALYTGTNQAGKDFVNVFCTLGLILATSWSFLKAFSVHAEHSLFLLVSTSIIRLGTFLLLIATVFFRAFIYIWFTNTNPTYSLCGVLAHPLCGALHGVYWSLSLCRGLCGYWGRGGHPRRLSLCRRPLH